MDVQIILALWLIMAVGLAFFYLKWGVVLLLTYFIFIPGFNIAMFRMLGFAGGENVIYLFFIIAYFMYSLKHNIKSDFYTFLPFIVLLIGMLIAIPFQDGLELSININYWRSKLMNTLFLSFIMLNIMKNDWSSIILFRRTMLICIFIVVAYAFFVVLNGGINPYAMFFVNIFDIEVDYESYYEADESGRLFGRISSVFIHPMSFALFLGCALIYLFFLLKVKKNNWIMCLIVGVVIMSVFCGVRSVLGGLFVTILYYLFVSKNVKLFIGFAIGGVILYFLLLSSPFLYSYFHSIAELNSSGVRGSSVAMRIEQLQGAVSIMMENPLFGLGTDWTSYYRAHIGRHPICLSFESLLFVILCNNGILGVFCWSYMIIKFFLINIKNKIENINIVNALMVFYISYSIITGEYNYMKYFLIFYVLMLGESIYNCQNNNISMVCVPQK